MEFKGLVEINKIRKDGTRYDFREYSNLLVDDGKEYILDFAAGIKSWHKPSATDSGVIGLLTFERWGGLGMSMFNNSSVQRAQGINGVPSGGECDYPILETILVSPEDSTLSNEIGTRVSLTPNRRDQTVELYGKFEVPGNIPLNTKIREFGWFLKQTGPIADPSLVESQKERTMICRTVVHGTGLCGPDPVYSDNPLIATDDIEMRWKFGEL